MGIDERRALISFRARLLAFADDPNIVSFERYRAASRRLDAVRAIPQKPGKQRAA